MIKYIKNYLLIIFITMCVFFSIDEVFASSFRCEYTYEKTTIYIIYDYDSPLKYDVKYKNSNRKHQFDETTTSKNFVNSNFVTQDGKLVCPTSSVVVTQRDNKSDKIALKPDSNGKLRGKILDKKEDNKEKNAPVSKNHTCNTNVGKDDEYSLYWANGKANVNLVGSKFKNRNYCEPQVDSSFVESDFADGKCPDSYYDLDSSRSGKGTSCKGVIIISKKSIVTDNDKTTSSDTKTNVGTGQSVFVNGNFTENFPIVYADISCDTIFGDVSEIGSPANWIHRAFNLIKYIAIVAVIVLSTVDFLKAVAEQNNDSLNKAMRTSVKRLIFAVMIFFLPIIVELIMDLLDLSCVIK